MTNKLPDGLTEQRLWELYCDYLIEIDRLQEIRKSTPHGQRHEIIAQIKIHRKLYTDEGLKSWLIRQAWTTNHCTDAIRKFYIDAKCGSYPTIYDCIYDKHQKTILEQDIKITWKYYCNYIKELLVYHKGFSRTSSPEWGTEPWRKYPQAHFIEETLGWRNKKINGALEHYFKTNSKIPNIDDFIPINKKTTTKKQDKPDLQTDNDHIFNCFATYKRIARNHFEKIKTNYNIIAGKDDAIDHIFSIKSGFEFKVPIWVINCPCNLTHMNANDNSQKSFTNHSTATQLYEKFFEYIRKTPKYTNEIIKHNLHLILA